MRNSQLLLFSHPGLEYGGSARVGKRKIQRPFDRKRPLHLVFRSAKARGPWSFLHRRHKAVIREILGELCERYAVKLHSFENVGNHLHLVVKIPGRRELRAFLRVFAQRVMFAVTGARKGDPKGRLFEGGELRAGIERAKRNPGRRSPRGSRDSEGGYSLLAKGGQGSSPLSAPSIPKEKRPRDFSHGLPGKKERVRVRRPSRRAPRPGGRGIPRRAARVFSRDGRG